MSVVYACFRCVVCWFDVISWAQFVVCRWGELLEPRCGPGVPCSERRGAGTDGGVRGCGPASSDGPSVNIITTNGSHPLTTSVCSWLGSGLTGDGRAQTRDTEKYRPQDKVDNILTETNYRLTSNLRATSHEREESGHGVRTVRTMTSEQTMRVTLTELYLEIYDEIWL